MKEEEKGNDMSPVDALMASQAAKVADLLANEVQYLAVMEKTHNDFKVELLTCSPAGAAHSLLQEGETEDRPYKPLFGLRGEGSILVFPKRERQQRDNEGASPVSPVPSTSQFFMLPYKNPGGK
ncbi:hypothetical protein INR49_009393 [Caranx melampygus]|nr:hypothetical protein INR49_009393 [Caranx melampygus]